MKNRFDRLHPVVSFSYYVGALALLMLLFHPIILAIGIIIILVLHFFQDRFRNLRRWFLIMVATGFVIIILNPLFNQNGNHILFSIFYHRITLEAVIYGATTALSIIGVIALFVSYNEVMTPNKIFYLFSKFLPQFAVLLMLTLRFIPLMRRRLEEISHVQASKGISVLEGTLKNRTTAGLLYVQILLTYSLEEAIQTADSMKARGYGQRNRTAYEYYSFKKSDTVSIIFLLILIIFILYGRFNGYGLLTIYPQMGSLGLSPMDTITLVEFLLFLGFPLFVETGARIRWRKLN
jgi:energy-coupling factor transport system permease protein